jgi:hypothetical protein
MLLITDLYPEVSLQLIEKVILYSTSTNAILIEGDKKISRVSVPSEKPTL